MILVSFDTSNTYNTGESLNTRDISCKSSPENFTGCVTAVHLQVYGRFSVSGTLALLFLSRGKRG